VSDIVRVPAASSTSSLICSVQPPSTPESDSDRCRAFSSASLALDTSSRRNTSLLEYLTLLTLAASQRREGCCTGGDGRRRSSHRSVYSECVTMSSTWRVSVWNSYCSSVSVGGGRWVTTSQQCVCVCVCVCARVASVRAGQQAGH